MNQHNNTTTNNQASAETLIITTVSVTDGDIQARLKAISEALSAKKTDPGSAPLAAFTCPVDPAERAACDSCQ